MSRRTLKKELKKRFSNSDISTIINSICPAKEIQNEKNKKGSRLERLSKNRISFTIPKKDENEKKYLNYCSYHFHPGIIGDNILYERNCLKGCSYYQKFTLE